MIVRLKEYWAPSLPIYYLSLPEKQKIYLKILEKQNKDRYLRKCLRDNWLVCLYLVLILKPASCFFWITNFSLLLPFIARKGEFVCEKFQKFKKYDFRSCLLEDFWPGCFFLVVLVGNVSVKGFWTSLLPFCYLLLQEKWKIFLESSKNKKFQWNPFIRLFVKEFWSDWVLLLFILFIVT